MKDIIPFKDYKLIKYTDFYKIVKNGKQNDFCADTTLEYRTSPNPVYIKSSAFYEKEGKENSLEYIANSLFNVEIAFTFLINSKNEILYFLKGENGKIDYCLWDKELINKSLKLSKKTNSLIGVGHTHPIFEKKKRYYGSVCSNILYDEKDLKGNGYFPVDKDIANELLRTKMYKKYGADYCDILLRSKNKIFSNYSCIISPFIKQIGIFEVEDNGLVIYHPWTISK